MTLSDFITPGAACALSTTPKPVESDISTLRDWYERGLICSIAGPTSTSGNNLWFECLVLTDAGRVECGLEPIDKPKPKARTLFD